MDFFLVLVLFVPFHINFHMGGGGVWYDDACIWVFAQLLKSICVLGSVLLCCLCRCFASHTPCESEFEHCVWVQDLKLKFYQLMIELDEHEGSYLAISKHYRAIYDTPQIKENKEKMKEVGSLLESAV